jgi:DNA-binding IclR family transcriptional regulator
MRVLDTKLHEAPVLSRLKNTMEKLSGPRGNITHLMESDGEADVCVSWQHYQRQHRSEVHRIGLSVVIDSSAAARNALRAANSPALDVDAHLSHMEVELQRMRTAMRAVLSEADFAKDRDSLYHQEARDLDQATIFWPIVQVCVLVMTGVAQVSHIVNFFKSRRII